MKHKILTLLKGENMNMISSIKFKMIRLNLMLFFMLLMLTGLKNGQIS